MKKNKAVILFLLRFFVSYFVLSGIYQWYLHSNQQIYPTYSCCGITELVTNHTVSLGKTIGYSFDSQQSTDELSYQLLINEVNVARIVEGCNSVSIIILFWAFIIAFAGSWQKTLVFGLIGSFLIYSLNIVRIIFIALALNKYPNHSHILHQIVFPAIIYGFTFMLWVIWVRFFANTNKK